MVTIFTKTIFPSWAVLTCVQLAWLVVRLRLFSFQRAEHDRRRLVPSPHLLDITQESLLVLKNLPDGLFLVFIVEVVRAVAEYSLALHLFQLEDRAPLLPFLARSHHFVVAGSVCLHPLALKLSLACFLTDFQRLLQEQLFTLLKSPFFFIDATLDPSSDFLVVVLESLLIHLRR